MSPEDGQTHLTSNQIKFVGFSHNSSVQGSVNEAPEEMSRDFKCGHAFCADIEVERWILSNGDKAFDDRAELTYLT